MLQQDFGEEVTVSIDFLFFQYGKSLEKRPYLSQTEPRLKPEQIRASFDYLSPFQQRPGIMFQRDENLND